MKWHRTVVVLYRGSAVAVAASCNVVSCYTNSHADAHGQRQSAVPVPGTGTIQ
jgi:hypothetical protein